MQVGCLIFIRKGGGSIMFQLSDQMLLYSYQQAQRLKLSPEFIRLLEREIEKRSLESTHLYR
ncbi:MULTISPECIES: sporulation histidine kinase inhibitor Sda [Sporosarcina]